MTKLVMMIVLACTIQTAVVYGQEVEVDARDLPPLYFEQKEEFLKATEREEVKTFYAPRRVCTQADMPRPGARFFGGPCVENVRLRIPINNSPAWDCEQVHGKGNCILTQRPKQGGIDTSRIDKDFPNLFPQVREPYYVPKCKSGFQLAFVVMVRGVTMWATGPQHDWYPAWELFCARDKAPAQ